MNFPTDPKKRLQIFSLIGVGVVAAIALVFFFVLTPMKNKQTANLAKIEELKETIRKAGNDIRTIDANREERRKVILQIMDFSQQYVLQDVLGNYQIKARAMIEAQAKKMGIDVDPLKEAGVVEIPFNGAPGILKGYNARISMSGGAHKLLYFLREIETMNPYLSVTSLSIVGQSLIDPERHMIVVDIQWPIWSDEVNENDPASGFDSKLKEMLKETDSAEEKPVAEAKK